MHSPRRGHTSRRGRTGTTVRLAMGALVATCFGLVAGAQPAQAAPASPAASAAGIAHDHGDRTGVAILDLTTGAYSGAGEDTAAFSSESVVKVFIAARLLQTGQMHGPTAATAYRMITASDDADATALYARAGGDAVVSLVAAHYGIADLGAPPSVPGRWGLTRITARGLVHFYAAVAKDPVVGPWLRNAMSHTSRIAADGTDQFFGLPSAVPGAVKQGWGHDGVASGHAVLNSTGYVEGGLVAVAILTSGPAATYDGALARVVTAQAQALVAGLRSAAVARAAAVPSGAQDTARSAAPAGQGPSSAMVLGGLAALAGTATGGVRAGRRMRGHLVSRREQRRARHRRRRAPSRPVGAHPLDGRLLRLPSGKVVRVIVPSSAGGPGRHPHRPLRVPPTRPAPRTAAGAVAAAA
jgi:hypothetical protein